MIAWVIFVFVVCVVTLVSMYMVQSNAENNKSNNKSNTTSNTMSNTMSNTYTLTRPENIALVVHSFDGYRRYWPGFVYFFKKYAFNLGIKVYFVTETIDVDFEEATILKVGKGQWGKRLRLALERVKEPYILHMQEDMWFTNLLDNEIVFSNFKLMQKNNWNHCKLQKDCKHELGIETDYNNPLWYVVSHQPGLWKKDYLLNTLDDEMTPFEHETTLNLQIHKYTSLGELVHCSETKAFPYIDVSRRGKLREEGRFMLEKEGLPFIRGEDEIYTRKDS